MTIDTKKKIGEIAAEVPGAVKILETWGIDYCCGGSRPLEQACATAGAPVGILRETLEMELLSPTGDGSSLEDWNGKSCSNIIQYILKIHHSYTRVQGLRLRALAGKVVWEHGERRPEILGIESELGDILHKLEEHMTEEEKLVFPAILKAEEVVAGGSEWTPQEGTEDYLKTLRDEHAVIGKGLRKIRQSAQRLSAPSDTCGFQLEFYDGLQELEKDLHHHVHLENNILFRKVREAGYLA